MAESAMNGWLYDVLDRAGLYRILIDYAQPLSNSKSAASDWTCELCDVKNFSRCVFCICCLLPGVEFSLSDSVQEYVIVHAGGRPVSSAARQETQQADFPIPAQFAFEIFQMDFCATLQAPAYQVAATLAHRASG
jgi:hypothetical protein